MEISTIAKSHMLNSTEVKVLREMIDLVLSGDPKINIRTVAENCYVSTTIVVRLAKKLGYSGYSEMLYSIREELRQDEVHNYQADTGEIVQNIDPVVELANDIVSHRDQFLFFVGDGFSSIITDYAVKRFSTIGIHSYDGAPVDVVLSNNAGSIVVLFSESGETADLISIAQKSLDMNYKVYAVSSNGKGTLISMADRGIVLKHGSEGRLVNIPDYYVGTGILLVEDIIAMVFNQLQSVKQ